MPFKPGTQPTPRSYHEFADLHYEIADALRLGTLKFLDAIALVYGERGAQGAARELLAASNNLHSPKIFDALGWREYMAPLNESVDYIDATVKWLWGAEYALQGCAPNSNDPRPRDVRVRELVQFGEDVIRRASALFTDDEMRIWRGVEARAALDFGGRLSIEGVQILSGISDAAVRNAVSAGDLKVDPEGMVDSRDAHAWLARRRDFFPSRWLDPADDQSPLDADEMASSGLVQVPQDADGTPFTPENVARPAKSGGGLSITVGAKGDERRFSDFYEALKALIEMKTPRWRRPNPEGNWGIVRARGAWLSIPRTEIDRQLDVIGGRL